VTGSQRTLCAFYALVALVALIATWSQNLALFAAPTPGGFGEALVRFVVLTKANPATRSITVDIGLFLLAAVALMVIEARRLGVRFVWLYVLFGFLVAISVTFPLFLIARETKLPRAPLAGAEAGWSLTGSDLFGLGLTAAVVAGLCWFVLA